jgi:hypothetical protein
MARTQPFHKNTRDVERGPDFSDIDASLIRVFALTESVHLQFRAESFNPPATPERSGIGSDPGCCLLPSQ